MPTQVTKLVPECNIERLEQGIDQLNKRCRRLSLPEITISKVLDHVKARVNVLTVDGHINSRVWMLPEAIEEANKKWPHKDTGERMAWYSVTVTGEQPTLKGWEFIAVLEPMVTDDGETLNLIQCLPGKECPTEQRTRINVCDHCQHSRRRKQTFVVYNAEAQQYKSVGRQCIKDFLGYHESPEALIALAEMLASLGGLFGECEDVDEDDYGGGGGSYRSSGWDMVHFLTLVACRIRLFGWLSAGRAFDMGRYDSTKSVVLEILTPPRPFGDNRKEWEELCAKHVTEPQDKELAEKAIAWAREIPSSEIENSDYLANVNLVARVGHASRKTAGVAASIIVAYQKAMEQEIKRQEFARRPESFHVGTVGERIPLLTVKCEKVFMSESNWGVTGIHKMTTEAGSDLTWFASGGRQMEEGETCHIAATVKEHGDYKGRKQTILTRVTILSDEEVAKIKAKAERKAKRDAKKAEKAAVAR